MRKWTAILPLVLALDAWACRFNVRDVGFVDLGSEPYQLYLFVPEGASEAELERIQSTAYATYLESNVKFEINTPATALEGEAKAFLPKEVTKPVGVLVSSNGERSTPIVLTEQGKPTTEALWDGLGSVFDSPRRNAALSKVYEHYGVILIVEGRNDAENRRVRKMADRVVATITSRMDRLEKEIREPPVVEVIEEKDFAAEKTFLWSLGVDEVGETPQVVALYGRGRRMGLVLRDERLDERSLTAIVNVIGLNCECGLDRKWMEGVMIPQKWDENVRRRLAEHLGFDPESPAIRVEMSQILAKGGSGGRAHRNEQVGETPDDLLSGYREGTLKIGKGSGGDQKGAKPAPNATSLTSPPPTPDGEPQNDSSFPNWPVAAGLVVLVGGTLILLRRGNHDS